MATAPQNLSASSIPPASESQKSSAQRRAGVSSDPTEKRGITYFKKLLSYITARKGRFVKDDSGMLSALIGKSVVPLNSTDNLALSSLIIDACDVSSITFAARAAIQRLQVHAYKAASKIQSRTLGALSKDEERIYLPTANDSLLQITAGAVQPVPNIDNPDSLWVHHPQGEAFQFTEGDPGPGLELFEELLVESQACKYPEMRWFVAINEGIFPLIRDLAFIRFLTVHQGPTQQGKTSRAARFLRCHELGDVTGNASPAALRNKPDAGLLVLDNKEHVNLTPEIIENLLFLSTGADPQRCLSDGSMRHPNKTRPVVVITSIEGVYKTELRERCVEIDYAVVGKKTQREGLDKRITKERDKMISAIILVLQRFLRLRGNFENPNPFNGNFDIHFSTLCDLLRAFGEVAAKPPEWAEELIRAWDRRIRYDKANEIETSELEFPIRQILESTFGQNPELEQRAMPYEGRQGRIYKTTAAWMLSQLQKHPGLLASLPRTPAALTKRLSSERFSAFKFVSEFERTSNRRSVGFFVPDDAMTTDDDEVGAGVIELTHSS
jgi:hypothetical protein